MKHYTFTVDEKPNKYGWSYTLKVFRIKKNIPEYIWYSEYRSWSMKWHEHECLDVLLEHKEITKKDYNKSESSWRGPGYYVPNNKFYIHNLR